MTGAAPARASETLLDVRDAHVRYPRTRTLAERIGRAGNPWVDVVRGVSLRVRAGETVAIVGESGSGKTTLAMALMGLVPMHRGDVAVDGQSLARDRRSRLMPDRARIAMMFQDPVGSLSPRMTVCSALAEPFVIHGKGNGPRADQANRLLDMVGLDRTMGDRYPHQLSGGQARRVGVARALALHPALVVADEPTAGLDVSVQGDVLNLLSGLQQRLGLGVLIITHNLNVVRHVADRMAIMYLGRFVEQGPSAAVFARPRHPYTRALLSANPSADAAARAERMSLEGEIPGPLDRPSGCEFHTRCPARQTDCAATRPGESVDADEHYYRCHYPLSAP